MTKNNRHAIIRPFSAFIKQDTHMEQSEIKRLYRSRTDRMIAGVCGGLAEYFHIDATLVRILFAAMILGGGFGIGLYIILWIVIPLEGCCETSSSADDRLKQFGHEVQTNAKSWTDDWHGQGEHPERRTWFAIILIAVGLMALSNEFLPWHWFHWNMLWPILIVLVGLMIIFRRK